MGTGGGMGSGGGVWVWVGIIVERLVCWWGHAFTPGVSGLIAVITNTRKNAVGCVVHRCIVVSWCVCVLLVVGIVSRLWWEVR